MSTQHTDRFSVSAIGGCLFLKLCGFVDAQKARIRDVSESHLELRIGSRLAGWLGSGNYPVDLEIRFQHIKEESRNPQSRIEVTLRDRLWWRSAERFDESARRILWDLKSHLMAH